VILPLPLPLPPRQLHRRLRRWKNAMKTVVLFDRGVHERQ